MELELTLVSLSCNQLYIRFGEGFKPALSIGFEIMFILRRRGGGIKLLPTTEDTNDVIGILLLAAACNPALCAVDDDFAFDFFCLAMPVSPSDMSAVSAVRLSRFAHASVSLTVC